MEVVERFAQGKLPDQSRCEDVIVTTPEFAGVFDGASDRTGRLYDGMLGGRWAAQTAAAVIEGLPADASAREASDAITAALAAGERRCYPDDDPTIAPAGTCMAMYSRARQEVWRVGDSHVLIDGHTLEDTQTLLEETLVRARQLLLEGLRRSGASHEELASGEAEAQVLGPLLCREHYLTNIPDPHPFGCGQCNAHEPVPEWLLSVVDVSGAAELVIASDGYCEPKETLEASERELAGDLAEDPLRIGKHPSFRAHRPGWHSFDDRAYLRLRL